MTDHNLDPDRKVTIELGLSEALVLDAMFWRWEENEMQSVLNLEHKAEWSAVWAVQEELQRQLEPLLAEGSSNSRYTLRLASARQALGITVDDRIAKPSR